MKQTLLNRGFKYTGSCNCHGGRTEWFEHPNKAAFRIEIGTANYWVKNQNTIQWQTVSYGGQASFENDLNKYWPI